jgi:DNA-binding IclR family transcriptional regulator
MTSQPLPATHARRPKKANQRSNSSTDRVLGLIDLFTVETPVWTVDEIAQRKGVARATVYRYLKSLVDAGFLAPIGGEAGYTLGPRFVEIDRQIRISDPLIRVARPVMDDLMQKGVDTQILCRFYGERVMTIYELQTVPEVWASFDRGNPFPLFRGAPSKCILAHLSTVRQQRLFLKHANEIMTSGLGNNWPDFRAQLKKIYQSGYAAASDINPALLGVAAPIFSAPGLVNATICLVRLKESVSEQELSRLGQLAVEAAASISKRLMETDLKLTGLVPDLIGLNTGAVGPVPSQLC